MSSTQAQQIQQTSRVITGTTITTNMLSTATVALKPVNPSVFLLSALVDMIQAIRYININYPPQVQLLFNAQSLTSTLTLLLPAIINIDIAVTFVNHPLPDNFDKYDQPSSFLANFWASLLILLLLLILIFICYAVTSVCAKRNRVARLCASIKTTLQWNFCISLFISYYGSIILYSSFEFQTAAESTHSTLAVTSLIICIGVNVIVLLIFAKIIQVLMLVRRHSLAGPHGLSQVISSHPGQEDHLTRFSVLFEEYQPRSWLQQSFIPIYIVRVCGFYFVIAYLFEHPVLQSVLITIIGLAMLLYVGLKTPMKSKLDHWQFVLQELVLLVVNICVVILAAMDSTNNNSTEDRDRIGRVIVWGNLASQIILCIFSILSLVVQLRILYLRIRTWYQLRNQQPEPATAITPESVHDKSSDIDVSRISNSRVVFLRPQNGRAVHPRHSAATSTLERSSYTVSNPQDLSIHASYPAGYIGAKSPQRLTHHISDKPETTSKNLEKKSNKLAQDTKNRSNNVTTGGDRHKNSQASKVRTHKSPEQRRLGTLPSGLIKERTHKSPELRKLDLGSVASTTNFRLHEMHREAVRRLESDMKRISSKKLNDDDIFEKPDELEEIFGDKRPKNLMNQRNY